MKLILTITAVLLMLIGFSQNSDFQKPNYRKIKKEISNKQSNQYYPKLFERFQLADTNLTIKELQYLYYGYLFSDQYRVYGRSDYEDSIHTILYLDTLLRKDNYKLIYFEQELLKEFPFNLRNLNQLSFAYLNVGDTLAAFETNIKFSMIVEAILSSGDGLHENTAWHVIAVSHEYDMLNILGFQYGGLQELTSGGCDYLKVALNEYQIEGFYFDVNQILEKQKGFFK